MATSLEHRSAFTAPADAVYPTLVDEAFLTERLRSIGGKGAALLAYDRVGESVEFTLRQGVEASRLPGAVKAVLGGDLVVEREERWRSDGPRYAAVTRVSIAGTPAEIQGQARLGDHGEGSLLVVRAQVRVGVPLVGGRLEKVVVEQVGKLLAAEAEFAESWLAERA
ncbi:DUF2505 domain-containing protein [Actinophytocola xanthii]|uniref:DUF2505 domain-containing protein n=1 Tax=Actinophytocola xanthii TaxID=1912961 RepID=A0A1Q8CN97_9PSEU|nr:DUF2505 domain-containing protein [Actinophytocola xanthii]OLF15810.1 hypothetical protein BU204_20315 [Actinophytocola xanthii]